jgi:hypothetical protein
MVEIAIKNLEEFSKYLDGDGIDISGTDLLLR